MQETWIQVQGADNISFCGCVVGSWPAKLPTPQWRVLNRMGMDGDGEFVVRNFCTELSVSWNFCVLFCLFVCIGLTQPIFSTFIVVVVSTHEFLICTWIQKCYSVVLDFGVFEHKQLPCLCKRSHVKIQSCFPVRSPNLTIQTCSNPPDILAKTERLFGIESTPRYLFVGWPMPGMHWRSRLWRFKRLAGAIFFGKNGVKMSQFLTHTFLEPKPHGLDLMDLDNPCLLWADCWFNAGWGQNSSWIFGDFVDLSTRALVEQVTYNFRHSRLDSRLTDTGSVWFKCQVPSKKAFFV